jgi:DNA primase
MDWVSFDEIKKTVSLQMVIEHYRVPLRHAGPNTLRGKCPLPTHSSKQSAESFTATFTKGVGGAWACQSQSCIKARGRVGGNVLDFVAAMERCSVRDAAIKLQTWFLVPAAGESHGLARKEPHTEILVGKEDVISKTKGDEAGESESNKPLSFTLQKIDCTHPYLKERGLTEETAHQFGVGIFPGKGSMQGRCVIPIHNRDGELVAYAGRAIDGSEPRYKFPTGFHKSLELFNLHRVKEDLSVVLVEGFFDCMKVTQAGFPCVALMGSAMSKTQQTLIAQNFASVVLMLDGDDAGRTAMDDIGNRLQSSLFRVITIELDLGMQPDQLSHEQIHMELDAVIV